MAKLTNLGAVLAPAKIDDVGYTKLSKPLRVLPSRHCAAKCEALVYKENLHQTRPVGIGGRPRRLENLRNLSG